MPDFRSEMGQMRIRMDFLDVFSVRQGRFVPDRKVKIGEMVVEEGQPIFGSTMLHGHPLYSLMMSEIEVRELPDGTTEIRLPREAHEF